MSSSVKREWILKAESEVRFMVSENEHLVVQLIEGNAEVFGIEVSYGRLLTYLFNEIIFAACVK